MKRMFKFGWFKEKSIKLVEQLESLPLSWSNGAVTYFALIIFRMLIEIILAKRTVIDPLFLFHEFTHSFFYFLTLYVVVIIAINKFLKVEIKRAAAVAMIGAFPLVLFPPVIDFILSHGQGYWSFYEFDGLRGLWSGFISFFGNHPEIGITYGPRIIAAGALIAFYFYARIKKLSRIKSISLVLVFYLLFYFLGTFPSWVTLIIMGWQKGWFAVSSVDVAATFLTPAEIFSHEVLRLDTALVMKLNLLYALMATGAVLLAAFLYQKEKTVEFFRSSRLPQIVYHLGIVLLGAALGMMTIERDWIFDFFDGAALVLLSLSVILAWIASVTVNDVVDQNIDELTNTGRPLIRRLFTEQEYKAIGIGCFVASVWFAGVISSQLAALMLIYQALAWVYSAWPLRLKRVPLLATFVASLASVSVLLAGFILTTPVGSLVHFPLRILMLLILAYTASLPIKDFKDIEGDAKDGVKTIPVVFGEEKGKLILATGVALSFMLSVIFLNESRLWWWAVLFGGAAYWMIITMKKYRHQGRVHYRNIHAWLLGVIVVYGAVIALVLLR